jgi:hypothetical protein
MIVNEFINELGNKIKNKRDTDMNCKTKEKITFNGISLSIIGPSSMSENIITR